MYRLQTPLPRLLLFALEPPVSVEEAERSAAEILAVFRRNAPVRTVALADVRASADWPDEILEPYGAVMQSDVPLLGRGGILYSPAGSTGVQLAAMLSRIHSTERRLATDDPEALLRWFEEVVGPAELAVIERFIRHRGGAERPVLGEP